MALYYDAATVLGTDLQVGSLKSRVYDESLGLQSKPAHLYALISETAKYDVLLSEVIENAGLLDLEFKLTPLLSLFLTHDLLFSKRGISASSSHHLRQAVERHKARLQAELTKARLRRKCATVEDLKRLLVSQKPAGTRSHPRWVRVNTLRSSLAHELSTTFEGYRTDATISEVSTSLSSTKVLAVDPNIPGLLALPPNTNLITTRAYTEGSIILQDKASCFPAYLLAGDQHAQQGHGDWIDGCAAPGNKTSHLAALCEELEMQDTKIFACERDGRRSKILQSMMDKSGATNVTVLAKQDFLALDPNDAQYRNVTHLLLDPSCSGSGILGREDLPALILPAAATPEKERQSRKTSGPPRSKKRKHDPSSTPPPEDIVDTQAEETRDASYDPVRLQKLSTLQAKIVEHAFSFPAALRVSYSTCSVHVEENENVVARVLASSNATSRGWRVLRREEQVSGLQLWKNRGWNAETQRADPSGNSLSARPLTEEEREGCIRCTPGDDEGTMGFFLCGFVREPAIPLDIPADQDGSDSNRTEESWEGFSE